MAATKREELREEKGITVIFHPHGFFLSRRAKKRDDHFRFPITPPEISSPPHYYYYYYYFDKEERRWWMMMMMKKMKKKKIET